MHLDWELCDLNQNVLTRLDNRRGGGYVELGVNKGRSATVKLSIEDPAYDVAKAIETVLRVTLRGPDEFSLPLFIGRIVIPNLSSVAEVEEIELNALDPLFHLERLLIRDASEPGSWLGRAYSELDQSEIMQRLVELAVGHGVIRGSYPTSIKRIRTYPPTKDVASALIQMSEVEGGPDFELTPYPYVNDGTLAQLDCFYPKQGSDLSATVRFVHGAAPDSAVVFLHSPAGDAIANRIIAVGAPLEHEEGGPPWSATAYPAYLAEHAASIAEFGPFEQRLQLEDVLEAATLEAHAKAAVAANAYPSNFFDFTAAPEPVADETGDGVPPVFGRDYWLGDTVGVTAWLAGQWNEDGTKFLDEEGNEIPPLELTGRVTDATVTEAASGQLSVKASCVTEASASGITGEPITVLIPEGSE